MQPATVASVSQVEDEFTVGAVGSTGDAMGRIPHSSGQT